MGEMLINKRIKKEKAVKTKRDFLPKPQKNNDLTVLSIPKE